MEKELIIEPRTSYTIHATDCDILGHLNNAKYIELFHNAREDHLKDIYEYDMEALNNNEGGFVVGSQQIYYFRSALCYEKVVIQSSLILLQGPKITIEYIMFNEKGTEVKSIMWTDYIAINKATGKRDDIPSTRKNFFERLLNKDVDVEAGILSRYKVLKGVVER